MYSNGASEVVLGKAIKKHNLPRDEIVIMTKVSAFCTLSLCMLHKYSSPMLTSLNSVSSLGSLAARLQKTILLIGLTQTIRATSTSMGLAGNTSLSRSSIVSNDWSWITLTCYNVSRPNNVSSRAWMLIPCYLHRSPVRSRDSY